MNIFIKQVQPNEEVTMHDIYLIKEDRAVEIKRKLYRLATNQGKGVFSDLDLMAKISPELTSPNEVAYTAMIIRDTNRAFSAVRQIKIDLGISNFNDYE